MTWKRGKKDLRTLSKLAYDTKLQEHMTCKGRSVIHIDLDEWEEWFTSGLTYKERLI